MGRMGSQGVTRRAAVVGGSIAGLSVAAVLGRLGVETVVYERSRVLDQRSGAGLGVDLGLIGQVTGGAPAPRHLRLGRRVVSAARAGGTFEEPMGLAATTYHVLREHLLAAAGTARVQAGVTVAGVEAAEEAVSVVLADGRREGFDLVVCADGRLSTLREGFGAGAPRYAGYVLWRAMIEETLLSPEARRWFLDAPGLHVVPARPFHLVAYPVPGATPEGPRRVNWGWYFGVEEGRLAEWLVDREGVRQPGGLRAHLLAPGLVEEVAGIAKGVWPGVYGELVATSFAVGAVSLHPVCEYLPERMARGRLCLVGDAAHLASPITGAGARTAMVDALALGEALGEARGSLEEALAGWEARRLGPARALVEASSRLGADFRAAGAGSALR